MSPKSNEMMDNHLLQSESLTRPGPVAAEYIRVESKIYDARRLAELHPGGPLFIKAFAGRDASQAFLSYHRRQFPHSSTKAKAAYERDDETVKYSKEDNQDFMELCDRVEKVLPRLSSFAPWYYYLKVAFLLCFVVTLEGYMHYNRVYSWKLSALMGLFYAWIGLNIQHDANHGAVSRYHWVNRALGASQNWIGGSAISWVHQHVVQHHMHTNDVNLDPDMAGSAFIRLNPLAPLMKYHIVQHIYFFFLLAIYGFSVVIQSFLNVVYGSHHTAMSPLLVPHRVFESFMSIIFVCRWVLLPLYQVPELDTFLSTVPMYMVCGYYLAFFFSISHNFSGVFMLEDTTREASSEDTGTFLYKQVVSSSNVGGRVLCFFNGGLNYQIEHHLFPRISHCHYPTISHTVHQYCQEKGIPYVHFNTVWENIRSCTKHLLDLGSHQTPKNVNFFEQKVKSQ
eukprot:GFUD01041922.1.p1 GENE.GFUD01041922.1~~GFUD01041922.1.p1  ORF type:complete len:452 (+),score=115.71 GFUD01041922.1:182-1537(+)